MGRREGGKEKVGGNGKLIQSSKTVGKRRWRGLGKGRECGKMLEEE